MICPFAGACSGLEAYASGGKAHLMYAFCLGEYGDCDRYKAKIVASGPEAPSREQASAEKDAILSKLRATFPRRPQ